MIIVVHEVETVGLPVSLSVCISRSTQCSTTGVMYYPVHIKYPLLLSIIVAHEVEAVGLPVSLSFRCHKAVNKNVFSVSLNKMFPCLFRYNELM